LKNKGKKSPTTTSPRRASQQIFKISAADLEFLAARPRRTGMELYSGFCSLLDKPTRITPKQRTDPENGEETGGGEEEEGSVSAAPAGCGLGAASRASAPWLPAGPPLGAPPDSEAAAAQMSAPPFLPAGRRQQKGGERTGRQAFLSSAAGFGTR
jgi:hypothetical protein